MEGSYKIAENYLKEAFLMSHYVENPSISIEIQWIFKYNKS